MMLMVLIDMHAHPSYLPVCIRRKSQLFFVCVDESGCVCLYFVIYTGSLLTSFVSSTSMSYFTVAVTLICKRRFKNQVELFDI